jgi:hypothetical protein
MVSRPAKGENSQNKVNQEKKYETASKSIVKHQLYKKQRSPLREMEVVLRRE